jgi:hypothetical protein
MLVSSLERYVGTGAFEEMGVCGKWDSCLNFCKQHITSCKFNQRQEAF